MAVESVVARLKEMSVPIEKPEEISQVFNQPIFDRNAIYQTCFKMFSLFCSIFRLPLSQPTVIHLLATSFEMPCRRSAKTAPLLSRYNEFMFSSISNTLILKDL